MKVISLKQARQRLRPFSGASLEWLNRWIDYGTLCPNNLAPGTYALLLKERARRKRCPADQTSKPA